MSYDQLICCCLPDRQDPDPPDPTLVYEAFICNECPELGSPPAKVYVFGFPEGSTGDLVFTTDEWGEWCFKADTEQRGVDIRTIDESLIVGIDFIIGDQCAQCCPFDPCPPATASGVTSITCQLIHVKFRKVSGGSGGDNSPVGTIVEVKLNNGEWGGIFGGNFEWEFAETSVNGSGFIPCDSNINCSCPDNGFSNPITTLPYGIPACGLPGDVCGFAVCAKSTNPPGAAPTFQTVGYAPADPFGILPTPTFKFNLHYFKQGTSPFGSIPCRGIAYGNVFVYQPAQSVTCPLDQFVIQFGPGSIKWELSIVDAAPFIVS